MDELGTIVAGSAARDDKLCCGGAFEDDDLLPLLSPDGVEDFDTAAAGNIALAVGCP